jgi:septal ring factor EnvC (AmiA/AmiB activator)
MGSASEKPPAVGMTHGVLRLAAFVFLVACCLPLASANAQTRAKSEAELRRIEQQQKQTEKKSKELAASSAKIQAEVVGLKEKLVEVSTRLAEHEDKLAGLQKDLVNLQQEEAKLSRQRESHQKDLSEVLAIVLRLSRLPPEALALAPTPPQQTIYTTFGMQSVMRELNHRIAVARQQLGDLAAVQEKLRTQQEAVSAAEAKISADRLELAQLIKQREGARRKTEAERKAAEAEARQLASRAADLRELIQKLRARKSKTNKAPTKAAPSLYAAGSARLPVAGRVTRGYGSVDAAGNRARGITVATQGGAVVNAPRAGNVAFAGAFRSYGQVVIIEISEGQHILLTGLGSISVSEGETVRAGEPVGRMPDESGPLYLETRNNGEPVDPATYGLTQS